METLVGVLYGRQRFTCYHTALLCCTTHCCSMSASKVGNRSDRLAILTSVHGQIL